MESIPVPTPEAQLINVTRLQTYEHDAKFRFMSAGAFLALPWCSEDGTLHPGVSVVTRQEKHDRGQPTRSIQLIRIDLPAGPGVPVYDPDVVDDAPVPGHDAWTEIGPVLGDGEYQTDDRDSRLKVGVSLRGPLLDKVREMQAAVIAGILAAREPLWGANWRANPDLQDDTLARTVARMFHIRPPIDRSMTDEAKEARELEKLIGMLRQPRETEYPPSILMAVPKAKVVAPGEGETQMQLGRLLADYRAAVQRKERYLSRDEVPIGSMGRPRFAMLTAAFPPSGQAFVRFMLFSALVNPGNGRDTSEEVFAAAAAAPPPPNGLVLESEGEGEGATKRKFEEI